MKTNILVILMILIINFAQAQTISEGTLVGKVIFAENCRGDGYFTNVLLQNLGNHATVASCFINAPGNFVFEHIPEGYYLVRITRTSHNFSVSPADQASYEVLVTVSNQSMVDVGTIMIANDQNGICCNKEVKIQGCDELKVVQASNVSGHAAVQPSLTK